MHAQVRVQGPAALEPDQVVLARGLDDAHAVTGQPLRDALRREPGLGRLDAGQVAAGERRGQAQRVAVADLALGHRRPVLRPSG